MASLDREIIALTKRVERTVAVSHTAQFKAAAARKVQTTRGIEAIHPEDGEHDCESADVTYTNGDRKRLDLEEGLRSSSTSEYARHADCDERVAAEQRVMM